MLDIAKNEFLSKVESDLRVRTSLDSIRPALEKVWEQAYAQALVDREKRVLQHHFGEAVMRNGGPDEVAKLIGVSADTVKRWVVDPTDMRLSEVRRFQNATGLSLSFEVLPPLDAED